MASSVLLANLATTMAMVGVIWTVQLVHYPLFGRVGESGFAPFEREHSGRITWLVGPLMLAELGSAIALIWLRPDVVPARVATVALALVAVAWLSTWFVQVPLHRVLGRGFDSATHERLVLSNWLRTGVWTLRGALMLWAAAKAIG